MSILRARIARVCTLEGAEDQRRYRDGQPNADLPRTSGPSSHWLAGTTQQLVALPPEFEGRAASRPQMLPRRTERPQRTLPLGASLTGACVPLEGRDIQRSAVGSNSSSSVRRAPPFFRLDVRTEKRLKLSDTAWISFIAEVMNATLNKESFGGDEVGPLIIPSLGAEIGF